MGRISPVQDPLKEWLGRNEWKTYQISLTPSISSDFNFTLDSANQVYLWMVYSLVVRVPDLEYGGREFQSQSLHLKPETKLREERGLSGCRKGLKTVPLAQALLSLKPTKKQKNRSICRAVLPYLKISTVQWWSMTSYPQTRTSLSGSLNMGVSETLFL